MQLEGKGGLQTVSDSALAPVSLGADGHVLTAQLWAQHYEATKRGNVFAGATAVTGVAPGTAIGTTAAHTLYNPAGSGVKLVVLGFSMGYISGTLGAGTVFLVANTNPSAAAVTGTAITAVKMDVSTATPGNSGLLYTTATVPATPTVVRPLWSLGASLASTAVAPWMVEAKVDGQVVVSPGCSVSLEAVAAAGSSPLVSFGTVWAEITE